jgi:hypothetical protein
MAALRRKVIFVGVLVLSATPVFADFDNTYTLGGYTIYDCSQAGSSEYQACLGAMAAGDTEGIASFGGGSDPAVVNPPIVPGTLYLGTASVSPDGQWALIVEGGPSRNDLEDAVVFYVWHNGSFFATPFPFAIDLLEGMEVEINDEGAIAAAGIGLGDVVFSPLSDSLDGWVFGDPSWNADAGQLPVLNDANQLLVAGFDNGVSDYRLFDPSGAPTPVPDPISLCLLATGLAMAVPRLRRIGASVRD